MRNQGASASCAGHAPVTKEFVMSSTTDKIKGLANEAMGNAKQAVGKATGNDRLRAEGVVQEAKGEAQQAVAKAKDAVKDVADSVKKQADKL
jgi:uncharacterized protein YjbJ (UPF0337 family)